jgi:hypothetical protein
MDESREGQENGCRVALVVDDDDEWMERGRRLGTQFRIEKEWL